MKLLELVRPGDLVFDVGASRGDKTAGYLERGARVVCIEPLPWRAAELRARYADQPLRVTVEECALGAMWGGRAPMLVCEESDVLSTLDARWQSGRFRDMRWNRQIDVDLDTLDRMIEKHGRPAFTKIDAELYERHILAGLSQALPCLSFEFHQEFRDDAANCIARCEALGMLEFNLGTFERDDLLFDEWMPGWKALGKVPHICGGDIYARVPA